MIQNVTYSYLVCEQMTGAIEKREKRKDTRDLMNSQEASVVGGQ